MMSSTSNTAPPLDGNLIRFEIRDGSRRINCTISNEALETVAGLSVPSTEMLRRRSFDRFRTLINLAAEMTLRTLPLGSAGPINLTSEDLRRVPKETDAPPFGSPVKSPGRSSSVVRGVPVSA
jgi:hypothetical protein